MPEPSFNQRDFFRLAYFDELAASIVINDREYAVPEISERGLRIGCARFREFRINEQISGRLQLINGDVVSISGIVLRRDPKHYVLGELEGLTLHRLMSEQRAMIRLSESNRETNSGSGVSIIYQPNRS